MEEMGPTVKTSRTIDVDKVHLLSESESRTQKPFKLRKTFGTCSNVLCFNCDLTYLPLGRISSNVTSNLLSRRKTDRGSWNPSEISS